MMRIFHKTVLAALASAVWLGAAAQDATQQQAPAVTFTPTGTVRTKFEYQPGQDNARFDVRTARFGVGGSVYGRMDYKIEIDLSDEGKMKMVDAYIGTRIYKGLSLNLGFMRVPFTIDAHRSPQLQNFANRSFIAKQVGGIRDVGAVLGWRFGTQVPVNIQLGMFNGSGLGDLQHYWTGTFDYSAKVQAEVVQGVNLQASFRTSMPGQVRMQLYDAGATWRTERWLVEGEYLRKEYAGGAFEAVNSIDAFLSYGIPIRRGPLQRISLLGRWDYLDNHSNGVAGPDGALFVTDPARHRATGGVTFSLGLPFMADIRVNYEKYFYRPGVVPGISDHDKIAIELMAHF